MPRLELRGCCGYLPAPPPDASEMLCFSGPHKILRAVTAQVNVTLLWLMELLYHHGHLVQLSHLNKDSIISRISQQSSRG